MANGQVADYITQDWLNQLRQKNQYLGLLTGDPRVTSDPLALEVLGSAYRRPLIAFELVGTILRNSQATQWTVGPMTTIAGIASFDAPFNGNWQVWLPLDTPVDYPAGGSYAIKINDLFIGIDS